MHVGEAVGDLLRRELALEVLLLERMMQIFQRVEHGAEAVEVGARRRRLGDRISSGAV